MTGGQMVARGTGGRDLRFPIPDSKFPIVPPLGVTHWCYWRYGRLSPIFSGLIPICDRLISISDRLLPIFEFTYSHVGTPIPCGSAPSRRPP